MVSVDEPRNNRAPRIAEHRRSRIFLAQRSPLAYPDDPVVLDQYRRVFVYRLEGVGYQPTATNQDSVAHLHHLTIWRRGE
jgi:hypothetical protein